MPHVRVEAEDVGRGLARAHLVVDQDRAHDGDQPRVDDLVGVGGLLLPQGVLLGELSQGRVDPVWIPEPLAQRARGAEEVGPLPLGVEHVPRVRRDGDPALGADRLLPVRVYGD